MMGLTPVQANCLGFIRSSISEKGIAPTLEEMRAHLNLANRGRLPVILKALEERGAIRRLKHRARAIEICDGATGFMVDPHPEVQRAIIQYAGKHRISIKAAAEEALRAYFVEAG